MAARASLTFPVLCLVITAFLLSADAQTDCPDSLTYTEFIDYTKTFPQCTTSDGHLIFRTGSGIFSSLYDLEDNFVGNVDYDALDTFCGHLQECKAALSSCQGGFMDFRESVGMALCHNDGANSNEIRDAVSVLTSDKCDINKVLDLEESNDGCSLMNDGAKPSTYLNQVARNTKLETAKVRCNARFQERVCSKEANKAYNLLTAASKNVELVGRDYSRFTDYQTDLGDDWSYFSLHGLTHIRNPDGQFTCHSLPDSPVLLWNTYLRIDGVFMPLQPTSPYSALKSITVHFVEDGVTVDVYTTSLDDAELTSTTQRGSVGSATDVKSMKIGSNQVLLSHEKTKTSVVVSRAGNTLLVYASVPTTIYNLETVGLMAEGCEMFGGVRENSVSGSEPCMQACRNVKPEVISNCAFDCVGEVTEYETTYKNLQAAEDKLKTSNEDVNSADSLLSSVITCLLTSLVTYLFH